MNTPSVEAIRLATKLSGHTRCQNYGAHGVCDGCLGDAATIEEQLQLPQRTVALLLAQQVVDAVNRDYELGPIRELRDALARIKP